MLGRPKALLRTGVGGVLDGCAAKVLGSNSCYSYVVECSRFEHLQLFAVAFSLDCCCIIVCDEKTDVRSSFQEVRDGPVQYE